MTSNQVVSTMFDFDICNHMVRFVLWVTRLKTLDIIFAIQVAMEYVYFTTHRSTVYVSWLCRLDWKICRTDPQCIPVAVLYYDCMDPQCMIGGHDFCLWCHQSMIWVWECLPRNWYIWYSADTWLFSGLWLDVLLVLDTHMTLTKSINCHWFHSQILGGILLSTFLVIGMISW